MSYVYKLDNNYISSALLPIETLFGECVVSVTSTAVNFFANNEIALGLNVGSRRIAYKHNGILFKTIVESGASKKMTYVSRPAIDKGFVVWDGEFSSDAIVKDLLCATNITNEDSNSFKIYFNSDSSSIFIDYAQGSTISYTGDSMSIDGESATGEHEISLDDISITIDTDRLLSLVNGNYSEYGKIDYTAGDFDVSYDRIDVENGIFEEVNLSIDFEGQVFDSYGHTYYMVEDKDFAISPEVIWFTDDDKYLKLDQFAFARHSDDVFELYLKDKIRSSLNASDGYLEGIIECSVRTFVRYAKVYSSYILVDYYYMKTDVPDDECASLDSTSSMKRACRLKIYNDHIVIYGVDDDLEYCRLANGVEDNVAELYDVARFGNGYFKSSYKMYTYTDYGDHTKIIFNRESSSKYIQVEIYDEPSRYKAIITVKNGSREDVSTKYYKRYYTNPLWSIGNSAYINVKIKQSFDSVSDSNETLFTNAAITVPSETVKILTRVLYVNINEIDIDVPQKNLSYDAMSLVPYFDDTELKLLEINFQPSTGAIYGRIEESGSYTYKTKDEMIELLNAINERYEFDMTCNISSLVYTGLDGSNKTYEFSNSTVIIAEHVIDSAGGYYRVYYKNTDSYGFVNARTFEVVE